jgi:hypothetical protein
MGANDGRSDINGGEARSQATKKLTKIKIGKLKRIQK